MLAYQRVVASAAIQNCICAGSVTERGYGQRKIQPANLGNSYEFLTKIKVHRPANLVVRWYIQWVGF